ncbi:MAG: alpha-amylase family glycosyl hydrolase [Candidatus Saccharibacteria bacterium]|nr:alpha-amylase family glycosyl hydrolase [Candidatus Saccharibacteria bacterium]
MTKSWRDVTSLYQIYPRSFRDTNSDGVGDLRGITSRLDYLSWLGIDAVWISPFFTSPMTDFGYDVADYRTVDPVFGSLRDFQQLLKTAHQHNIKVMIDLVPCHTSDQHPWFQQSRASTDNPKRDWYVWRDGKDGQPPNNWRSLAGGSSWTLDEVTGQYYLHSFLPTQPDLNWDNPAVRQAMKSVVRFWFDMGVDGMRVDAIWGISKDHDFGDDEPNPDFNGPAEEYGAFRHTHCKYGPHFQEYLHELASVCDEYDERQMVFEFYPDEQLGDIYDQYRTVLLAHPRGSAFFMEHRQDEWHAERTGQAIAKYLAAAGSSLPFFCVGNHDQPRITSRLGAARARALQFLNLTCPGVGVVYYGDEIGMENGELSDDEVRDTFSPNHSPHDSRDRARTPMQWANAPHAGFSFATPWLPVHDNHPTVNVLSQLEDPKSLLHLHRNLLRLRKELPIITKGSMTPLQTDNGYILTLRHDFEGNHAYTVVNFADQAQTVTLPDTTHCLLASEHDAATIDQRSVRLMPYTAAFLVAD